MMQCRFKLIVVSFSMALMLVLSAPLKAETVNNLYTATWPVESQSSSLRAEAIVKSFEQALVRVSGSHDVLRSPTIRAALSNAKNYMRRYSYQRLSAAEQMIYEKPLLLKGTFDKSAIIELLKSASQPVWGEERPSGLFWIAFEKDGLRKIANEESLLMSAGLDIAAQSRGLPVILPLMDIEDQNSLSISDVWGGFAESISAASERYARDYWVAGRLSNDNGQWQGRWLVTLYGRTQSFTTNGLTSYEVIDAAVDRVADSLSSKLAVVLSEHVREVMISIENIKDFQSFAKLQKFMNTLGMVRSAGAVKVSGDTVLFKVESLTAPQNLIEAIKLGNNLRLVEPTFGFEDAVKGDFHFILGTP